MCDMKFVTSETAWCPGCGNFNILEALRMALERLNKKPHEVLIVGGIGQAAKNSSSISMQTDSAVFTAGLCLLQLPQK